jgi:hypothetical protein
MSMNQFVSRGIVMEDENNEYSRGEESEED